MIESYIVDATARQLHIMAQKEPRRGRKPSWLEEHFEVLDGDIRKKYIDEAERVLLALARAGFVALPEAEVREAWVPRRTVEPVRPVLSLTRKGPGKE